MTARGRYTPSASTTAALTTAVVSALVILAPVLQPGYALIGDMVFVPRLRISGDLVGLSSSTPRAVPSDAVVALASTVLPGQLVQKLVLFVMLVAAGAGAGLFVRVGAVGAVAATLAAIWNPYDAERLAAGQWAVLVGYAAFPWAVRGAWQWGAGLHDDGDVSTRRVWLGVALPVVLGSLGGAPAWLLVGLGATAGFVVGARRKVWSARGLVLGGLLATLALPWAVPALIRPGGTVPSGAGAIFAPRPDTPFGLLPSLLTGGGIWNADVVPPGRDTVPGAVAAVAVGLVGAAGLVTALRDRDLAPRRGTPAAPSARGPVGALTLAGAAGLALAAVVCVPSAAQAIAAWPSTAVLRDGARQVGPWVVAVSVGVGIVADAVSRREGIWRVAGGAVTAAVLSLLPVAALPSVGWGVAGRLSPVDYPRDYQQVADRIGAQPTPGAVVVTPFEAYRRLAWNGDRPVLDPLPRWLPTVTVASSDLLVRRADGSTVRVPGEDPFANEVRGALGSSRPAVSLGALGVRWVVVDVPGVPAPEGAVLRWAGTQLRLYEIPHADALAVQDPGARWRPARAPVLVVDVLVALSVLAAVVLTPRRRRFGRAPRSGDTVR